MYKRQGQWFAFQPVLPRENLTNVNYGQNENVHSNTKVIEMKGFGNGFNNTCLLYTSSYSGQTAPEQFGYTEYSVHILLFRVCNGLRQCFGPVSYTHLDVYKRQAYHYPSDVSQP